jgi:mannose-1-phosphate guanylyltransferase
MVKSAILLVGGMGTRMHPLTLDTPKPMLPLLGKPITEHQIMKAKEAGITEIVLATSYLADVFTPYFGNGEKFGINISYAVEEVALGTGGAIANAAKYLKGDGPVMIFNGDVLSNHSLQEQISFHETHNADVTLYLTEVEDARAFGVVEMIGDKISTFNEKMETPPTKIINAGCYIFNREVINEIPRDVVVSVERETFPSLLARGADVMGFVDRSYWLDIGSPKALLKATKDLIEATGYPAMQAKGSRVDPGAEVAHGSYIGQRSVIDSGAVLHNCVIGEGATIGAGAQLTRTFVASGQKIAANTVAEDEFFGFSPENG